jgi:hypothetical protein
MLKLLVDILGWAGALLVLGAYAGVSFRRLAADGALYQFVNGLGSCFLVANTIYYRALPSAFVNAIWLCIAVATGIRMRAQARDGARVDG